VRRDLCVIANVLTKMMVFSDAPGHSRMRNQLGQMFSPRNVAGLRDRIQQIADELIDAVSARRKMDFVQDFANPLPLLVVADIMGFRREDKVDLKRWSDVFGVMLSFSTTIRQDLEGRAAMLEMRQYFDRIVDDLRREPNDSMLSQLITPRDGTAPIDFDELFANCVFLLAAGHETTASTMSSGIRLLLTKHPGELQRLIDDPSLIPNAAEELLRMESPVQWTSRRAKEDLELGGQKIAKNSMVMISMGAANRDPRQFPDPHRLDITRKDANRHLAFSGGNHFCLGAGLARIELQVGLSSLLRRLKNLCIEDGFEVEWRKGHTLHAFDHLPMTFEMFTKSGTGASH
jgi:cytochrome P450